MSVPEELLMAYADGELNAAERAAERAQVEAAMKADPDVARRVERHRALRAKLSATFDRVLDEPVPDRLIAACRSARAPDAARPPSEGASDDATMPAARAEASIADLSRARAAKAESAARSRKTRAAWSWPQWGAIAASLVVGVIIGHVPFESRQLSPIAARDGHLLAQAGLAAALSNQLVRTQPASAPVQIGMSFRSKSGAFCRTFVLYDGAATGGLACRSGNTWDVRTLARAEAAPGAGGGYRPAASEMPPAVRAAVEEQILGDPLDSSGEAQARINGWK